MPKQLCMSVVVELPDETFTAAGLTFKLSEPWVALCEALKTAGVKYQAKVDEIETRAKVQRKQRAPRVVAPASEAA